MATLLRPPEGVTAPKRDPGLQGLAAWPAPRSRPPFPARGPDRSLTLERFMVWLSGVTLGPPPAAGRRRSGCPCPGLRCAPVMLPGRSSDRRVSPPRPPFPGRRPGTRPGRRPVPCDRSLERQGSSPGAAPRRRSAGSGPRRASLPTAPASTTTACVGHGPKPGPATSRRRRSIGQRGLSRPAGARYRSTESCRSLPTPPVVGDPDAPRGEATGPKSADSARGRRSLWRREEQCALAGPRCRGTAGAGAATPRPVC